MQEEVTGTVPASTDVAPTSAADAATAQPVEPKTEAQPATPPPEPRKPDPRQRKIAELSYQNRELERRIDRLLGVVEKTTTNGRQPEIAPPKIEEFSNLDDYIEAKLEYREKVKAKETTTKPEPKETPQADDYSGMRDSMMEAGSEKYEDFEEVVFSDDVKISPVMAQAIFGLDEPSVQAEVAYYLAKNPKDAKRIAGLPPVRQITEIGKLEMKLASEPEKPKKPSAAPKPIDPVNAGRSANDNTLNDADDMKTWMKKRNKQLGR